MFTKYPEFSSSDTRYAFAVGRVRALETRLLDRSRLERMLDAESADDALRMLQDTDYGTHLGEASSAADYEKVLESERRVAYDLFRDLCLDRPALSVHFSKFDFHNVRVLVKAKFAGREHAELLSEHGEFEVRALKEAFDAETFEHLPEHLASAALEGIGLLQSSAAARLMDIAIDRAEHQYKLLVARRLANDFLLNLLRLKSDVQNILTLYRIKWLGEDYKAYEGTLLEGGFLEKDRLREAFSESLEGVAAKFAMTPYAEMISAGAHDVASTGSFSGFEKAADDYMMGYLKLTKLLTLGLEPLYSYILVREYEIKSVRMIMVGKLYGIPDERIKERLPVTF